MFKYIALLLIFFPINAFCKQLKVAVVDTGFNFNDSRLNSKLCHDGHANFTNESMNDINGHGTAIISLIEQYAKNSNYCIIILKYYSNKDTPNLNAYRELLSLHEAVKLKVDIVNLSGGGYNEFPDEEEIIEESSNITYIVSTGNDGKNIDKYHFYPASYQYSNIISVGSFDFKKSNRSNKAVYESGEDVKVLLPNNKIGHLTGTSLSTAIHTGKFIYKKQLNENFF